MSKQIVVKKYGKGYTAELKSDSTRWGCGKTEDAAIGSLVRSHWQLFLSEEVALLYDELDPESPEFVAKQMLCPTSVETIKLDWQGLTDESFGFRGVLAGIPCQYWVIETPCLPGESGRGVYLVLSDGKWLPQASVTTPLHIGTESVHLILVEGKWEVSNA